MDIHQIQFSQPSQSDPLGNSDTSHRGQARPLSQLKGPLLGRKKRHQFLLRVRHLVNFIRCFGFESGLCHCVVLVPCPIIDGVCLIAGCEVPGRLPSTPGFPITSHNQMNTQSNYDSKLSKGPTINDVYNILAFF